MEDPRWNAVNIVKRVERTGLEAQIGPDHLAIVSAVDSTWARWSICLCRLDGTWLEVWSHTDADKLITDMEALMPDYDVWNIFHSHCFVRHRSSGDVFAVEYDGDTITGAAGPLARSKRRPHWYSITYSFALGALIAEHLDEYVMYVPNHTLLLNLAEQIVNDIADIDDCYDWLVNGMAIDGEPVSAFGLPELRAKWRELWQACHALAALEIRPAPDAG